MFPRCFAETYGVTTTGSRHWRGDGDLDPDVYNDRRDRFVVERAPPTYTLFLGDVLVPQLTTLPALYFPTGQHLMLQQ